MLETRKNLLSDDQRKALEAKEKSEGQKERRIAADMNEVFATGAGMNVLRWIMDECGFLKPSVVYNKETYDVQDKATVYNEARRNLYLRLRKYLKPSITTPVENRGLAIDESDVDIFT